MSTSPVLTEHFDFAAAAERLKKVVKKTPLERNARLSAKYGGNIYLKREDLQQVRSYKIRGAYNLLGSLPRETLANGVVCASAGNHAQGFAFSCKAMDIRGVVFMPNITPKQKVNQVRMFGEDKIEIILTGDTFDDCQVEALRFANGHRMRFVPPFDDYKIIEGQGTIAMEVLEELPEVDYLFVPV